MIPESIKQVLPENGQKFFMKVYAESLPRVGDTLAIEVAWEACKTKMTKNGVLVANSEAFEEKELHTFNFEESDVTIVMNAESDELVLEAELANTDMNTEGRYFTESDLEELSKQINAEGSSVPDIDHVALYEAYKMFGPDEEKIKAYFSQKKGLLKTVASAIRNGKLWIRATLDKRYKNHIPSIKNKVSIEAIATNDGTGRLTKPKYLGFTLTDRPKIRTVSDIFVRSV